MFLPLANVPAQCTRQINVFAAVTGDKMAMRPFAKLLFTLSIMTTIIKKPQRRRQHLPAKTKERKIIIGIARNTSVFWQRAVDRPAMAVSIICVVDVFSELLNKITSHLHLIQLQDAHTMFTLSADTIRTDVVTPHS